MREVKFRAWDVINKVMYPIAFPSWNGQVEGKKDFINNTVEYIPQDGDDIPILMQFTGLKDKNGKDIYEGDIIKGENGVYIVDYDADNVEFVCQNRYSYIHPESWPKREVIGNKYENQEAAQEKAV